MIKILFIRRKGLQPKIMDQDGEIIKKDIPQLIHICLVPTMMTTRGGETHIFRYAITFTCSMDILQHSYFSMGRENMYILPLFTSGFQNYIGETYINLCMYSWYI
jgi:hypothetical protein